MTDTREPFAHWKPAGGWPTNGAPVPSRDTIQRFKNRVDKDGDHLTRDDINGDWVDYADHEKIVNGLLAEVERLNTHAERLSRINREVLAESELLSATSERLTADKNAQQADIIILHDKLTAADNEWAASVATIAQLDRTVADQGAEVERLTTEIEAYERLRDEAINRLMDERDAIRVTVADQAAALAERDKVVAEMRSTAFAHSRTRTLVWADRLAASVSTQEEK